jgi:hypothetical protein
MTNRAADAEPMDCAEMAASWQSNDGRYVDFHPTPAPQQPRYNALGQSIPRVRRFGR